MDSDLLEASSELIVKGMMSQDLTYYVDMLAADVTLNVLYDNQTLPAPTTNTATKDGVKTDDPRVDTQNADPNFIATLPVGISTEVCSVFIGPEAFADATYHVYSWMLKGKYVVQPRVSLEPRRPRKDNVPNQSSKGGSTAAQTTAATEAQLKSPQPGMQAERNAKLQNYSKLTVIWGRTKLHLRDECYFDEGKVIIVDRYIVAPEDPTDPQYVIDRRDFLGETQCKVNTRGSHPPVLDFTFSDVNEVVDLLRVKPQSGRLHRMRGVEPVATKTEKHNSIYQLGFQGKQTGKTLIKAKNKKGEEEAYEFTDDKASKVIKVEKEQKDDVISKLAEQLSCKYEAEAFRFCNGGLQSIDQLVPVLRSLVANSFLTISWIDVSNNCVVSLPNDLTTLPLTTLYLHGNRISDWGEIDRVVCNLPRLSSLTLHGNPIAQQPSYKQELLSKLMTAPKRATPLRQLDFVAISTQDLMLSGMHEVLTKKGISHDNSPMMKLAKETVSARQSARVNHGNISPRTNGGSLLYGSLSGGGTTGSPRLASTSPRR